VGIELDTRRVVEDHRGAFIERIRRLLGKRRMVRIA
jgi:hypothetical protein